jgi:hypothetical protein
MTDFTIREIQDLREPLLGRATYGPDAAMMGGRSRSTRDRRPFVACTYVTARRARLTSTDLPSWLSTAK